MTGGGGADDKGTRELGEELGKDTERYDGTRRILLRLPKMPKLGTVEIAARLL